MTLDAQTQQIADRILAGALQSETVEAGLFYIYDMVIAWAEQASLDALFACNEILLDQERSEEARLKIPARDYLRLWTVEKLRAEPLFELNQRLMEREYQPQPEALPAGSQPVPSASDIAANGRTLAGSLSIPQALDFFETLFVRYASLVDPEKVRQTAQPDQPPGDWTGQAAFNVVFTRLYYVIVEPMSGHGPWPAKVEPPAPGTVPQFTAHGEPQVAAQRAAQKAEQYAAQKPPVFFYETGSPDQIFRQRLAPDVLKAYQEAAYALIHYRVMHEHARYSAIGAGMNLPVLNDFATLSLTGDGDHWAQPVPGVSQSLRATSLLLLAGIAAPAVLIKANIDPLADTSSTGQRIWRMLEEDALPEDAYDFDDSRSEAMRSTILLYETAEKEVKARWSALERVAEMLLEAGELSKEAAYQIFAEPYHSFYEQNQEI